jgi:hypothetical protein
MLTAILFALLGIALGQFIKVEVDPKLTAFIDDSLTQTRTKALPAATSAVKRVKAAMVKPPAMPSPDPAIQARLDALDA